jgi:hypothetical protein
MAKTPRLKFYGIELTIPEIKELILCAGSLCNPATIQGRVQRNGKYSWLQYGGSYVKKDSKATAKEHPKFVQLGLLKYDKKIKFYVWTALGAAYLRRVARNNTYLRLELSNGHYKKLLRLKRKKKEQENQNAK